MPRRTLRLDREALVELQSDLLAGVAGGASVPVVGCDVVATEYCVPSHQYSCLNCITHPPCITDVTTR